MILDVEKKDLAGIVLWQGKSLYDGKRIMVVASGIFEKTENRKTGDMVQIWIMRKDINPIKAKKDEEYKSYCGNCKMIDNKFGDLCYVNCCHGPLPVFNNYHDGGYRSYQDGDLELLKDRYVRVGAIGDPAFVPIEVWDIICNSCKGFTGYTHQWNNPKTDQNLKKYFMASCDSITGYTKEFEQAQEMGWKTFRIREGLNNPLADNEFICPASKEAGNLTDCQHCGACSGNSNSSRKNPVIIYHKGNPIFGFLGKYIKLMTAIKNKKQWRKYNIKKNKKKIIKKVA